MIRATVGTGPPPLNDAYEVSRTTKPGRRRGLRAARTAGAGLGLPRSSCRQGRRGLRGQAWPGHLPLRTKSRPEDRPGRAVSSIR